MPTVLKSGSLNHLEPSGPVQACNGIALPFTIFLSSFTLCNTSSSLTRSVQLSSPSFTSIAFKNFTGICDLLSQVPRFRHLTIYTTDVALYYERKSISNLQIVIEKKRMRIMTYKQHLFFNVISIQINPLKPELNPIFYLLALLGAHHFLHVSRIRVKSLTFR